MDWLPVLIILILTVLSIVILRAFLRRRIGQVAAHTLSFQRQAATVGLVFLGLMAAVLALPESIDENLAFSVVGLVVTGALAISGQSIIANGMAGILLRIIKNFGPGDFIEVDGLMGRVSEMGLFHTEIQSPDRDLITLPNSRIVNEPVRVLRKSGTIVSVTAGIGYDVSRHELKALFVEAASRAQLTDPFVQVLELGDYAVTYRVAGFLDTPEKVLARRSKLREAILDTLSEAGIEIMSPMFVAQRSGAAPAVPDKQAPNWSIEARPTAEAMVFDKADMAAEAEQMRGEIEACRARLDELEVVPDVESEQERAERQGLIQEQHERIEQLTADIVELETTQESQT